MYLLLRLHISTAITDVQPLPIATLMKPQYTYRKAAISFQVSLSHAMLEGLLVAGNRTHSDDWPQCHFVARKQTRDSAVSRHGLTA